MIDTHCHLLPGLDDGPVAERGARSRLEPFGERCDVRAVHAALLERFPTNHLDALGREASLTRAIENAGVELELAVAAELSRTGDSG